MNTKQLSTFPGSAGLWAPRWSEDNRVLIAFTVDSHKLLRFDFATAKWSELTTGNELEYPNLSHDGKYVYFENTEENGPEIDRVNIADHRRERVVSLKDIPQVYVPDGQAWSSVDRTDAPIIMRNVGTQEIYALDLQLP